MTIFTLFFSLFWFQILNFPALLHNKNTWIGPFPWKRSVLQNPDRETTDQSTGICIGLGLPYNNYFYHFDQAVHTLYCTYLSHCLFLSFFYQGVSAMSCINELLSKNCVPVEFEEFLLKLFQQTFQLLQRITKDTGAQAVDNLLTEQDEGYCVKHFS